MLTRTLLHIWGPFCIYTYGAFIALGCIITYYLILKHPKRVHLISEADLLSIFSYSILIGIIGARVLFMFFSYRSYTHIRDIICITEGGGSLLGTIFALLFFVPAYLYYKKIPLLPALDIAALYAPLLEAIARLGCFFAGCCYGKPTTAFWAIRYTRPDTLAPLNCWLHPTQLYSSLTLFAIFVLLYSLESRLERYPGTITSLYIILMCTARCMIDFLRGDREFIATNHLLSLHQIIAVCLIICASIGYVIMCNKQKSNI